MLEALTDAPRGSTLAQLSTRLALHKSTTHRLLSNLIALGYARQDQPTGLYFPSLRMFELGSKIIADLDILELAKPSLDILSADIGEVVHLVIRNDNDILYIYKVDSAVSSSVRLASRVGLRSPMYCTAVGKCMLAALPQPETAAIWHDSDIKTLTPHTITSLEGLYAELATVRRLGYALDNQENELGIRCVAAPICNYTGQAVAAISTSAPISRMDDIRIGQLAKRIVKAAAEISAKLGG